MIKYTILLVDSIKHIPFISSYHFSLQSNPFIFKKTVIWLGVKLWIETNRNA